MAELHWEGSATNGDTPFSFIILVAWQANVDWISYKPHMLGRILCVLKENIRESVHPVEKVPIAPLPCSNIPYIWEFPAPLVSVSTCGGPWSHEVAEFLGKPCYQESGTESGGSKGNPGH